jgi:hypothetical protein
MNAPLKIISYLLGLGVVFAAAVGVGAAVGPIGEEAPSVTDVSHTGGPARSDMEPGSDAHSNDPAAD